MKILQGRQKLLLSVKGRRSSEFHLALLPRMDSQGALRTCIEKPTNREPEVTSKETGSFSDPLTEKQPSKKQKLEGDSSAAVFNFILNNPQIMLGFLQHLKPSECPPSGSSELSLAPTSLKQLQGPACTDQFYTPAFQHNF